MRQQSARYPSGYLQEFDINVLQELNVVDMGDALILLDAVRGKFDFPELKIVALDQYKYWEPESVIIESKATGVPLAQEFRRMAIAVVDFIPSKGKDKHSPSLYVFVFQICGRMEDSPCFLW